MIWIVSRDAEGCRRGRTSGFGPPPARPRYRPRPSPGPSPGTRKIRLCAIARRRRNSIRAEIAFSAALCRLGNIHRPLQQLRLVHPTKAPRRHKFPDLELQIQLGEFLIPFSITDPPPDCAVTFLWAI